MKISINSKFIIGPYGGGMQFATYLRDFLLKKGAAIVNNLTDKDIDIILHVSPFPFLMKSSAYSFYDAFAYKLKHPRTIIVQRINECDERKGTNYMNNLLTLAAHYSDHIVYIASWLKQLLEQKGTDNKKPNTVILNGADNQIFNYLSKKFWDGKSKLKIVTHHWGANYNKGHKVYQQLDKLLERQEYSEKFEFTFIGNSPPNLVYRNTKLIKPLSGAGLAGELRKHHVYLTASLNEPAGMHHIEGALCGLPLLYINSGALPEYCGGYGLEFDNSNFTEKLWQMHREYDKWVVKIKEYNNMADKMAQEYYEFFLSLDNENKENIVSKKIFKSVLYQLFSKLYNYYWLFKKKLYV